MRRSSGLAALQAKYFFYAMVLGFSSGATASIPSWGINIYPAWHFFICIYAGISTYAIFKYHLMDIKVAFSRLGIFIFVYSVVLGIPFGSIIWGKEWLMDLFGQDWFWGPMVSLLFLATAGPFIYIFMQRKAEDQLLREERRINDYLPRLPME
jgi:hypothetical protein